MISRGMILIHRTGLVCLILGIKKRVKRSSGDWYTIRFLNEKGVLESTHNPIDISIWKSVGWEVIK